MSSRLLHIKLIESVKTVYVNGKRYSQSEFKKARQLEQRRSRNGRFVNSK
jgi:hypothetical protein